MISMSRPKKQKVVSIKSSVDDDDKNDNATSASAAQQPALKSISPAAFPTDFVQYAFSGAAQRKFLAAKEAFGEALQRADALKELAAEQTVKLKVAERVFEAKMKRVCYCRIRTVSNVITCSWYM